MDYAFISQTVISVSCHLKAIARQSFQTKLLIEVHTVYASSDEVSRRREKRHKINLIIYAFWEEFKPNSGRRGVKQR